MVRSIAASFCIGWVIGGHIKGKSFNNNQKMKRVTSIGGVFLNAKTLLPIRDMVFEAPWFQYR